MGTRIRRAPTDVHLFVGDVHGCGAELDDLLTDLAYDPERHRLWFVGDLVNRGPRSLQTLRRVIEVGGDAVLGNHDLHVLGRALGSRQPQPRDTVDDLLEAPDRDELLGWLRDRPVIRVLGDFVLVHAGLHPAWWDPEEADARIREGIDWSVDPFEHPELTFATTVRRCDERGRRSRDLAEAELERQGGLPPWDEHYRGDRTVVFGHWAARGLVLGERVRGLDTGCVWGGRLTAWVAEEDRVAQVPAKRAYQRPDA